MRPRSAVLALLVGCVPAVSDDPRPTVRAPRVQAVVPSPRVPRDRTAFAPSQIELAGSVDGTTLSENESCAGCHADAAAQWRTSAHSIGSFNNPVYRTAIERFRQEVGMERSRFCGGCHDPALLVDGAMDQEIRPSDPRAHVAIGCRICHNIESVSPDGNGSYRLATSPIPIPREGDPESLRRHRERLALPPLRTASLCGACHRSFLGATTGNPAHIVGMDELTVWSRSVYAGSLAERIDDPVRARECRHCHMPDEDASLGDAAARRGVIASHRFVGAHTWLAAMRHDDAQLARERTNLEGAVSLDIAAAKTDSGLRTLPADGALVQPGEGLTLDLVLRNQRVGHRFPGGVLDAQDVWIEVVETDASGQVLAEAGKDPSSLHRLHAMQVDDDGTPLFMRQSHRFRAAAYDHTLRPRDATVVRYRFDVPLSVRLPLVATARLLHRSRALPLVRATCQEASTPRGRAFAEAVERRTGEPLDACVAPPITEVSKTAVSLGTGTKPNVQGNWKRFYDHGLGLLHALQEQVEEARPSLELALTLAPTDLDRAMVWGLLAELAVLEGRTGEALEAAEQAERKLGAPHPALARARARAFTTVWRWQESLAPLVEVARNSPRDDLALSTLAIAYGSAGEPRAALEVARRGLELQPRDQDFLRVQALALETLHAPAGDIDIAKTAYLECRSPDDAPRVRAACSNRVAGCALERVPVHVHAMRSPQ
ncbi:MAG: multiheme c-type cytochrome [Myxococcales bacterium]